MEQVKQELNELAELIVQTRLCEYQYEMEQGKQKNVIDCLLEEVADRMHDMGLFDDVYYDWYHNCISDARRFFDNKPQRTAEMVDYLLCDLKDLLYIEDLDNLKNDIQYFVDHSIWSELFSDETNEKLLKKLIVALGNFSEAKTLDLESFDSYLSVNLMKLVEKCDAVL